MSGRTWIMMVVILGTCWGGFITMLIYGMRQQARRQLDDQLDDPARTED